MQNQTISASSAKHAIIEELVTENIVQRAGRIQKKMSVSDVHSLEIYLQNKYGINDLRQYIEILSGDNISRNDLTKISGDSKLKPVRTFKGFLVDCYELIEAKLNGNGILIKPDLGSFVFIFDYETFEIPSDITIVGIENPENFRHIDKQRYLFENIKPLFACRYPQNQSKDFLKWLQSIPNNYLHFGDFDYAGIGIYLNEYKKVLGNKAKFFIPSNIEEMIEKYGNKELYLNQNINYDENNIAERNLQDLITIIDKHKKGLEQEIFIKQKTPYIYAPKAN